MKQVYHAFDQTSVAQQLVKSSESAELSSQEAIRESPFSIASAASRSFYQSDDSLAAGGFRRTGGFVLTNSLIAAWRSGLNVALRADYETSSLQQPTTFGETDQPFDFGLRVSYDITRGGIEERRARQSYSLAKRTRHLQDAAYLDAKLRFIALSSDYFLSRCKILLLEEGKVNVSDAVKTGRIQQKTRTISHKDFLNFLELENAFLKNLAIEEANRAALSQSFVGWGEAGTSLAGKLDRPLCQPDLNQVLSRAKSALPTEAELDALSRTLPAFSAALASQEAASSAASVARLSNSVSISPFVSGNYIRESTTTKSLAEGAVGIALQWTIPGPRGTYEVAAAQTELAASGLLLKRTNDETLSRLRTLQSLLASQQNILTVLARSLENSRELLRTLEAQQAIGSVDTLSFTNASVNTIETQKAVLDSWGTIENTMRQLTEYRSFGRR
jgi:hypothetical protein